jgi:Holliday junction resolvase
MMPKYAARSDSNQQEIIDALRDAGCSVVSIHRVGQGVPDLIVGRNGWNYLLECKVGKAGLTPDEFKFYREWKGQVDIVRSVEDALRVIGRL